MKTEFQYYDENKELKNGNIIISLEYDGKKYIVFEDEDDKDSDKEILQIREYEEIVGYPNLYVVDEETLKHIKDILLTIYNNN